MGKLEKPQYGFSTVLEEDNFTARVYVDYHNKRIKLLDYNGESDKLHDQLIKLCEKYHLGKIISIVPKDNMKSFADLGYMAEGSIDGYLKGAPGYCVSFFSDKKRSISENTNAQDLIVKKAQLVKDMYAPGVKPYKIQTVSKKDIESLSHLFDEVFKTYPTPMNDPVYIGRVINENVLFKVAYLDGKLVSAASADMNMQMLNAEITDCATYTEYRGKGLLSELVYCLEQELRSKGFITLFSFSRALSPGINMVFSKHGYNYAGRLINNCNIMGKFEDMNIWVKRL